MIGTRTITSHHFYFPQDSKLEQVKGNTDNTRQLITGNTYIKYLQRIILGCMAQCYSVFVF